MQKYGFADARDVLERASARETAARVAAGTLAKLLLAHARRRDRVARHPDGPGPGRTPASAPAPPTSTAVDAYEVRCLDPDAAEAMVDEIKAAAKDGDSLGGVVEVLAYGVPVGLGSHVHWDRKLDAVLAQALMSIQAVKGVEIGDGFEVAGRRGSEAHDPITWTDAEGGYRRGVHPGRRRRGRHVHRRAVVVRAAMKPLATLNRPTLGTVDVATKEERCPFKERTDVTAVPALAWWPRRWWPSCWPTRPPASSAATPSTSWSATTTFLAALADGPVGA